MINRERKVEELVEYTENTHLEAIKSGTLSMYENEYELVKGSLGLPPAFMKLDEFEQQIVMFYNDADYIEPNSKKHTKNNSFVSFLSCYKDQELVSKLYKEVSIEDGYDREGKTLWKKVIQPNPEYRVQRYRLKTLSTAIWESANLKEISDRMRTIIENDGFKDDELLSRIILDDALSSERDSFTLQSRKMAMDIKGMKKPSSLQNINVYLSGGGDKANRVIVEESGNQAFELMPPETNE